MSSLYQTNASQIMQKCSQALLKQHSNIHRSIGLPHHHSVKKQQPKLLLFTTLNSSLNPQQQSQNNKIIQKLTKKHKKKRQSKEVLIRKTDLGDNQLIFTKQELQKLKSLDDQQIDGTSASLLPQNQNIFSNQNSAGLNNKKYFNNQILDNSHQQIQNYLQWVDFRDFKSKKEKKKSKILNFQKRQKSSSGSLETLTKKIKNPLPALMPKHISSFGGLNNLVLGKVKSCYPLIKKDSVDKGFLNSINVNDVSEDKKISDSQKLNQILFRVNQKIERQLSSSLSSKKFIYMTEERKQALFECEVLRKVKLEIGPKFYQNLQLTYGKNPKEYDHHQDDLDYDKQNNKKSIFHHKQNSVENSNLKKTQNWSGDQNSNQKNYLGPKDKNTFESQAQKMINKNRNRLKQERKRVIQKIIC